MADLGYNPPGLRHDVVVPARATSSGLNFGDAVIMDTGATTDHMAVKSTTTAGDKPVRGIVVSQHGPSGCAVGDMLEVCTDGICEVKLAASQTITKGDLLITSTTAGAVKELAAEGTYDIVGRALQDCTSGAGENPRIAVEVKSPPQTK